MAERSVPETPARNRRALRGVQAFRDGAVGWSGGWIVSGSNDTLYRVSLRDERCECADHLFRGATCAHIFAVTVARAKTRRCAGCGEPTPRRDLIEVAEWHESLTYFQGDMLCEDCASDAGVDG